MVALRSLKRLTILRRNTRCLTLVCLAFVLLLVYNSGHQSIISLNSQVVDFTLTTLETATNLPHFNPIELTADDLKKALMQSGDFLVTVSKNRGKNASAVCVVEPGITECRNMGFAAFLLYTLDQIMICRALGINQTTVKWRACNSVCSQDPKVNSWNWYFEPVNQGLESKVGNVLCPVWIGDTKNILKYLNKTTEAGVTSILDNSFRDRTDVEGYEESRIITTQERIRINEMIRQYVKPNSRIRQKVKMFYRRYLAGFAVLGVHVRGTDHWAETSEKRLPSLMSWVRRAKLILETLPRPRKIFIASDNNEIVEKFLDELGVETVVYTEAIRAKKYHSEAAPHDIKFVHNATHPYEREIGTQVLMDILLLAKCDVFLHVESSVAALASYFNPRMTSFFLDEKPASKVQRKLRERRRTQETRKMTQDETDSSQFDKIWECFQKNSAGSACPNTAKGIFVSLNEVKDIFHVNKKIRHLKTCSEH